MSRETIKSNPFAVESPEKLEADEVYNLFVEENSGLEVIRQRKHAFIWGPRGSGKSMLLRFLEPKCQGIRNARPGEEWEAGIDRFLNSQQPFIGIRIPCKEGYFNKTELDFMDKPSAQVLTEHMMNLSLAAAVFIILEEQFPSGTFPLQDRISLARSVSRLFDRASIAEAISSASELYDIEKEPFNWAWCLFDNELRKIQGYLRQQVLPEGQKGYRGATSGYHDFLLPFAKAIQRLPKLKGIPIYFLIDDADRLRQQQQQIVNSWMANRDQNILCIKAAAQFHEYKTLNTRDGWLLETPHDYSEFYIEELYSASGDAYTQKVEAIIKKRLLLSGIDRSPYDYLPPDPEQEALLKEMRGKTATEWTSVGQPGRQSDYVHRYAVPRLFQELRRGKKRRNYAGFENIVHLSSGIIRYFLEPCYIMYEEMILQKQVDEARNAIPPGLQGDVLFKFSEDLILDLEKIRKDLSPEKFSLLDRLALLLNSLGAFFYENLTNPASRDARLFSFTIRGEPSTEARQVLELGVRYRYFQLRTYSTKEGGGREHWYVMNRFLCPIFKLDPTGFGGRLSIQSAHLDLAMKDTNQFLKLRLNSSEQAQPDLFSLED